MKIGRANAAFQLLEALKGNRAQRRKQQRFLVEGVRPIEQARAHGWEVQTWLRNADVTPTRWALDTMGSTDAEILELTSDLYARLTDRTEPTELIAAVALPPGDGMSRIARDASLIVALDAPQSPGNLGSIIRSADALGADGVIVSGHAADPFDPQAVRASTGSLFAVPVGIVRGPGDVIAWARDRSLQLIGTDEGGDVEIDDADLTSPAVLVFGNEARGLSAAWRDAADTVASIPISGSASSLNIAAAASIALHVAARQRRT